MARPLAEVDFAAEVTEQPMALGHNAVLVDRLQVLLAGGDERVAAEVTEALGRHADHLAHTVLHEARVHVRLLDDLDLVRPLHQLVDLRAHRRLDDLE